MRRRLLPEWVALWQYLGVRPSEIPHLTLDDAIVIELWVEDHERERQRAEAARAAARNRGGGGRGRRR